MTPREPAVGGALETTRRLRRAAGGAVLIGVLSVAPAAWAGPEDVANEISAEIMSPYCPGVTLHDCPSAAAVGLRDEIAEWARAGMTKEAIFDRLEDEYGPSIRGVPPAEGRGLLAWTAPAVALACGALVAFALARRWSARRRPSETEDAPGAVSADDRRRLEAELARVREQM